MLWMVGCGTGLAATNKQDDEEQHGGQGK